MNQKHMYHNYRTTITLFSHAKTFITLVAVQIFIVIGTFINTCSTLGKFDIVDYKIYLVESILTLITAFISLNRWLSEINIARAFWTMRQEARRALECNTSIFKRNNIKIVSFITLETIIWTSNDSNQDLCSGCWKMASEIFKGTRLKTSIFNSFASRSNFKWKVLHTFSCSVERN